MATTTKNGGRLLKNKKIGGRPIPWRGQVKAGIVMGLAQSLASNQERVIAAPKPLRITPNLVNRLDDLSQPWTRSPTKSKMEPVLATWHFVSPDRSPADGSAVGTIFHLLKLRTYSL